MAHLATQDNAQVNAKRTDNSFTALSTSVYTETVKLLLDHYADVNERCLTLAVLGHNGDNEVADRTSR